MAPLVADSDEPAIVLRWPPPQGPAVAFRVYQSDAGETRYQQANITEIKRIVGSGIQFRERRIAAIERSLAKAYVRLRTMKADHQADDPSKFDDPLLQVEASTSQIRAWKKVKIAAAQVKEFELRLDNAKKWRDFTVARATVYIDHALATTPYRMARCQTCRPESFSTADSKCLACKGLGTIRVAKTEYSSVAATDALRYLKRVLPAILLCAKIQAKTADADDALKVLLTQHAGVVRKFGNATQTGLEADDAEQGAKIGLFDAALRFDPVKPNFYLCARCDHRQEIEEDEAGNKLFVNGGKPCPKCHLPKMSIDVANATFQTYAWNWAFRNSRARKKTDERPGLQPSIDDPVFSFADDQETGASVNITKSAGKQPTLIAEVSDASDTSLTALDLHEQIDQLEDSRQQAVVRLLLESCTTSEIADRLEIDNREVIKLKKAAFALLRERLQEQEVA